MLVKLGKPSNVTRKITLRQRTFSQKNNRHNPAYMHSHRQTYKVTTVNASLVNNSKDMKYMYIAILCTNRGQ